MKDITTALFSLIDPAYDKTCKVIESCNTLEQYESSLKMVSFFKAYMNSSIDRVAGTRRGIRWVIQLYYNTNIDKFVQSTARKFS